MEHKKTKAPVPKDRGFVIPASKLHEGHWSEQPMFLIIAHRGRDDLGIRYLDMVNWSPTIDQPLWEALDTPPF